MIERATYKNNYEMFDAMVEATEWVQRNWATWGPMAEAILGDLGADG